MCVARYGSKFQNGLVRDGLRVNGEAAKHYAAYFTLDGGGRRGRNIASPVI